MTTEDTPRVARALAPRQAWTFVAIGLAVVFVFAFVALPHMDQKPARLSGEKLADFDLEVLSGEPGARLRLGELRDKPVVLDFWASWCQPCREQSVVLSRVAKKRGAEFSFVGVATGDERESAAAFVKEHQPAYVNVFDDAGVVARSLSVRELPTLVVLDRSGVVRSIQSRVFSDAELTQHLSEVLQ